MTENSSIAQTPAQAVIFLEILAGLVEKSPVAYSTDSAADLAAHIRGMAEAITTEANVNPGELTVTRQYAARDWRNEAVAVLFAAEHRATFLLRELRTAVLPGQNRAVQPHHFKGASP